MNCPRHWLWQTALLAVVCQFGTVDAGILLSPARVIGIDHVPVAVRDLEAASERYRRLGFVLKEGRPHANGIRNRHAKFPDGTEIELITAAEPTDALTRRYVEHLREGDGPAFLAFFVRPYASLRQALVGAGFRASDSGGMVTLSGDSRLPYIFFGSRQHSPTDRPEHFQHPNTAVSLTGAWLAANDLSAELKLLTHLGARVGKSVAPVGEPTAATVAEFAEGSILLLPASRQLVPNRRIVGLTLTVRDIAQTERTLGPLGQRLPKRPASPCERVVAPPAAAHGVWLEFTHECRGRP